MHIIGKGDAPSHACKPPQAVRATLDGMELEFYTTGRGIAFGFDAPQGDAESRHDPAVATLCASFFPPPAIGEGGDMRRPEWNGPEDDGALIDLMLRAKQSAASAFGGKHSVADLWHGRVFEKNNETDMALASHLAFWTGCDGDRMERLMRRSGLAREKWDTHKTYLRELTIKKACVSQNSVYTGAKTATPQLGGVGGLGGLQILSADEISPKPISWLWHGWLAEGKLHLLAGAPGCGKTTLSCALGATMTRGGNWPDGTTSPLGDVLLWSGEDGIEDTLIPRFIASGADRKRVHFIGGVDIGGVHHVFNPSIHLPYLVDALDRHPDIRLLIVDPIVSVVAGADSHNNSEVRNALKPLVDLAERRNIAIVGITHFSKGTQGRDPTERATGSIAFTALARVVMVAAEDKATEAFILARSKSNIGPNKGGFSYRLDYPELQAYPGVTGSRVIWGESLSGDARELLSATEGQADNATSHSEATEWLALQLADGPVPSATLKKEGARSGHSWRTLERAKEGLGVRARKNGPEKVWVWEIPSGLKEPHILPMPPALPPPPKR